MDMGAQEGDIQMPMQGDLGGFRELLLQSSPKMKLTPRRNGTRIDEIRPLEDEVKKVTRYRECQRNHAARIGGYALDGCGEFMASGKEGTSDALKCATCDCHRNFHRREVEGESSCNCHHVCNEAKQTPGAVHNPPLALPATSATSNGVIDSVGHHGVMSTSAAATKKRFRTKFSQEQKDKMLSFAEKLGWKIQKYDEGAVQAFCIGIGVKRHALKVWMHNNKNTLGKQIVSVPALHPPESNLD